MMTFSAPQDGLFPVCLYSPSKFLWASHRVIGLKPMHGTAGICQALLIVVQGEYDCHYDQIANIINYSNFALYRSI